MEKNELRRRIREVVAAQHVITLSFADCDGPWAAPVFYAAESGDEFGFLFVSNPASRHSLAIAGGSPLAATLHSGTSEWTDIKGLQMTGRASLIEDKAEQKKARRRYTECFPFTKIFFAQQDLVDFAIRDKASSVRFYRFRPERIVLVDNSVEFGFHAELEL